MSSRLVRAGGALVLMSLLGAAAALGEIHPTNMDCGTRSHVGPGTISITGPGPNRYFVLTDLTFSPMLWPGDQTEAIIKVHGSNSGLRTYMSQLFNLPVSSAYQLTPLTMHWTTGIPFFPNETFSVEVENIVNRGWSVTYTGYLVDVTPAGVGAQTPTVAPSHLAQNVPNPFNPSTNITYKLASAGDIKLRFYDSTGRMVRTLIDGRKEAGQYTVTWDGKNDSGQALPSGVYYYELGGGAINETRKAILLK